MPTNKPKQTKPQAQVQSNGTMFFEPVKPGSAPVKDLTLPQMPQPEIIPPLLKPGQAPQPIIGPPDSPDTLRADPGTLHVGDYTRPGYNPTTKI